jgi:hypothetical protein
MWNLLLVLSHNSTNLLRENSVGVQYVSHCGNFCFWYHLTAQLCKGWNGARVKYVAKFDNFCFYYHLTAQLCDVRMVLECNFFRAGEPLLLLSYNSTTLWGENGVSVHYVAHSGCFCFCYYLTAQLFMVRTVLECNMWRMEEPSASVITEEHTSETWKRC